MPKRVVPKSKSRATKKPRAATRAIREPTRGEDLHYDLQSLAASWRDAALLRKAPVDCSVAVVLNALVWLVIASDHSGLEKLRKSADGYTRKVQGLSVIPRRREVSEKMAKAFEQFADAGELDPGGLASFACTILEVYGVEELKKNSRSQITKALTNVNARIKKQGKPVASDNRAEQWTTAVFRVLGGRGANEILSARNKDRAPDPGQETYDAQQWALKRAREPDMIAKQRKRAAELAAKFPEHSRPRSSR